MKRLNKSQQDYLCRKFTVLCNAFLDEQHKAINKSANLKPYTTTGKIKVTPTWAGAMCVIDPKSISKSAAHKKYDDAHEKLTAVRDKVYALRERFAERLLFSTNDFEETSQLLDSFKAELK